MLRLRRIIVILFLFLPFFCRAEKVHLATDRDVYVAGDVILCSVWCSDDGEVSDVSSISYIELINSEGLAATSKIALINGRGAGSLTLPLSLPSGNYRIFAFTQTTEEAMAKDISIINASSAAKVPDGVSLSDKPLADASGGIKTAEGIHVIKEKRGDMIRVTLHNTLQECVSLSLSVYEDDGLRGPGISPAPIKTMPGQPESDGEVIRAKIHGQDAQKVISSPWLTAVISAPGSAADTYTGKIDNDGTVYFNTNNIYGKRDLVCEIFGLENEGYDCYFAPISPFVEIKCPDIPALDLSPAMEAAILARHNASPAATDTLFEFMPVRENLLLSNLECRHWHFDDYTRFGTVEDIIVELVPIAVIRKVGEKKRLKLLLSDKARPAKTDNVLVMLDGVPVSDHERLLSFDAMALSDLYVYPYSYALGKAVFNGVMNFVTTHHDMSALEFADKVRIIDFQGCSYPVSYSMSGPTGNACGRTLLWQPVVELPAGGQISYSVPDTGVPLFIVAEGNSGFSASKHSRRVSGKYSPNMLFRGRVARKYPHDYNGTPYHDTCGFRKGKVMYNGLLYEDVFVQLDSYEGKIEVRQSKDLAPTYPDERQVSWFTCGDDLFVNLNYQKISSPEGFMLLEKDSEPAVFSLVNKQLIFSNPGFRNGKPIGYFDPEYNSSFSKYFEYKKTWWILKDNALTQVRERKAKRVMETSPSKGHFAQDLIQWHPVEGTGSDLLPPAFYVPWRKHAGSLPAGFFEKESEVHYDIESIEAKYKNKLYIIGSSDQESGDAENKLSGLVLEEDGTPLPGTLIYVDGEDDYTVSGDDGVYELHLRAGEYKIHFSNAGKIEQTLNVQILGDGKLNVIMHEKSTLLDEAVVSAESMRNHRSLSMGVEEISSGKIAKIPTVFGEKDILKVILALPGVQTVGEASSGFNVRGGTNDQNLILFNGNTVYYPSHFFGINSVFNPDVIGVVDLYKGSVPAKYGGRASSVLNVRGADGNLQRIKGSAALGVLTSRFHLDGPLGRSKKTSFMLGARASYSDWILKQLPSESEFRGGNADFWDANLGISHMLKDSSSLHLYIYSSGDQFSTDSLHKFSYYNNNASLHWNIRGEKVDIELSAGYDQYGNTVHQANNLFESFCLSTGIKQYFLRSDLRRMMSDKMALEYGGELLYYHIQRGSRRPWKNVSNIVPGDLTPDRALQPSLYFSDTWTPCDSVSIEGIVRLAGLINEKKKYVVPEVRFSGRYSISPVLTFKTGASTVSQFIHLISNTAIISPMDTWKLSDSNIRPTIGWQTTAGVYWTIGGGKIDLSAEAYYKRLYNYYDAKTGARLVMNEDIYSQLVPTRNKAYGLELMARKSVGRWNGWISYTWSRSFLQDMRDVEYQINEGEWYPSSTDKPHDVKFVGNYAFTHRYSLSLNIDYSTGRPVSFPEGVFRYGGGNRMYYSSRNSYRIPDYFRVDVAVNIDPGHYLKALTHASLTLGCYNVTGRKNAYSVFYNAINGGNPKGFKMSIFAMPVPYFNFNLLF